VGEARWVKPESSVETRVHHRLPGSELRRLNVEVHMPTYSLFATDHWQQVANRQYDFDHDGGWGRFR